MNYKLAKQLKDAGLPMGLGGRCGKKHNHIKDQKNCVYVNIPSLEELIDACGDGFGGVDRTYNPLGKTIEWSAWETQIDGRDLYVVGKTPLIAVAKLYIKL